MSISNCGQPSRASSPTTPEASRSKRLWNDPRRFRLTRETLQRCRHRIARERRGLLRAVPVPALIALIQAILPLIAQIFELIERVFQTGADRIARDSNPTVSTTWPIVGDLAEAPVSDLDPDLVRALGEVLSNLPGEETVGSHTRSF